MKLPHAIIFCLIFISSCTSYSNLLVSKDYQGDKIKVQQHYDPCCGWAGLRFIYNEQNKTEHIIYYYWFDVPYAVKEVRNLSGKKVIHSEKYQMVFDTSAYREPFYRQVSFDDSSKYDINDELLSTKKMVPNIPLNHIDSILLFHSTHLLTGVEKSKIWLLDKAVGFIKTEASNPNHYNGEKKIK